MKLKGRALKRMKDMFPVGWVNILRQRIIDEYGPDHSYSAGYITQVLNPEYRQHSDIIVEAAIKWFMELKAEAQKVEAEILN